MGNQAASRHSTEQDKRIHHTVDANTVVRDVTPSGTSTSADDVTTLTTDIGEASAIRFCATVHTGFEFALRWELEKKIEELDGAPVAGVGRVRMLAFPMYSGISLAGRLLI